MHFHFLVSYHFKLSEHITLVFEKKNFEPFQHSYRCGQNINKVAREGVCSELPQTKRKSKSPQHAVVPAVSHSIALFDFGDRPRTGIFSMVQRLFVALCATRSEGAIHLFISGIIASNG